MDAETKGLVERLRAEVPSDVGDLFLFKRERLCQQAAATITRLTAERDEARARTGKLRGALERIANGPRDAAETYAGLFAAICTEARAALTQEAAHGQS